jgi:hypothetical protein
MHCKPGFIYTRKNHMCVKGIGPLRHGNLSKHGYTIKKKSFSRHISLKKSVKEYGPLSVFRKLNALSVYTKRRSPRTSKTAKRDRNWIKSEFL